MQHIGFTLCPESFRYDPGWVRQRLTEMIRQMLAEGAGGFVITGVTREYESLVQEIRKLHAHAPVILQRSEQSTAIQTVPFPEAWTHKMDHYLKTRRLEGLDPDPADRRMIERTDGIIGVWDWESEADASRCLAYADKVPGYPLFVLDPKRRTCEDFR